MLEEKIYKNYKELCNALDWKVSSGNTKVKQLKELDTLCEYHKEGNKFVIDKIYKEPKEKLGIGLYKEDIEILLLNLLAKNKNNDYFVSLTIKNLLKALEMVNANFVKIYNYKNQESQFLGISKKINVDTDIIGDIFYLVKDKTKRNLISALNDLVDKALIIYELRLNVCKIQIEYETNLSGNIKLDDQGNPIIKEYKEIYDYANEEEKALIIKTEKYVLEEMGIKKKSYLNINKDIRATFVNKVNKILRSEADIKFYYYTYDISYNKDDVLKELNRSELAKVRNRLNKNVLEQVLKTIRTIDMKTKEKYKLCFGVIPDTYPKADKIRIKDNYRKDGNKTARTIIDRKTRIHID